MATQKIGRYEVQRELGRGGMAVVYLGYDPYVKRQVAIKVLPRQFTFDPQFRARFQREAEVIATLEHPFIVPVHDFGGLDDQPFIVMRYMPGGSLLDRVRSGPLPLVEVARIISRLAEALDAAHSQGIIHRDIKPGNILFDARGEAYLSDFGIAKISESSQALTGTGMIGTPEYMSPDQARGMKDLDGRSDVYSLAVVVFQALTGKLPYNGDTPMSMAMAHITQPVPNIRTIKPELPAQVETIIPRGMAKDPKDRYRTAGELARDLNRVAQQTEMRPPSSQATVYEPYSPPMQPTAPPRPVGPTMPPPIGPTMPPPVVSAPAPQYPATPAPQYPLTPPAPAQPRGGSGRTLAMVGGAGVLAVLAIGCCVGLLAMGGLGGLFNLATSTPEATATLLFVPTDTPAPATETETPTETPIEIPTDTPSGPLPQNVSFDTGSAWPAVLVEDFEKDSGLWFLGNEDDEYASINRSITNGVYRWDMTSKQGLVSQLGPDIDSIADFYVSVDARLVSGPPDSEFGVRLRSDSGNYYIFMVNQNQEYAFFLRYNNDWTTLIDWTNSDAILPNQTNQVAAKVEGTSFTFYINGVQVDSATNDAISTGKAGLATELYGAGTQAQYEFDNFQLRQAWPVVLSDTFDAPANGWGTGSFDDPRVQAERSIDGTYVWDATALEGFVWRSSPTISSLSDQYVAVDALRVSGPADAPYGVVLRDDGDNYYYFKISDDGYYQFALLLKGEWQTLIDWTTTDAVRQGDWNRLAVVAQGSHFTLFVNGQQVGEADNSEVSSGEPGLVVELFNAGDKGVVEFDNYEVRAP